MNTASKTSLSVVAFFVTVAIIAAIVVGGWQIGWWFKTQNTQRNTQLNRHSLSWQQSYLTAAQNGIDTVRSIDVQLADPANTAAQKSALNGERIAIVSDTCNKASLIDANYITPDVATFVAVNCH